MNRQMKKALLRARQDLSLLKVDTSHLSNDELLSSIVKGSQGLAAMGFTGQEFTKALARIIEAGR